MKGPCPVCRAASDVLDDIPLDQGIAFVFAFARTIRNAPEFLCVEHGAVVDYMCQRMEEVGGDDEQQEARERGEDPRFREPEEEN